VSCRFPCPGPRETALASGLKSALQHRLSYVASRMALALLQSLPWSAARALARRLGDLGCLLDRRRRKLRAVANLRRAFPDLSEAGARRILRSVYRHFAEALLDTVNFARFARHGDPAELFETEGFEKLRHVPDGSGVIFVTGHFGHWEVLGLASPLLGLPVWSIARDTSNPFIARYVQRLRESSGQKTLPKADTWRQVIRLIKQGEHTALLIDQDARRNGIFVDFFGRPASTAPSAGRLAVYTGAPVAFAYARRIPRQNRFRLVLKDLILPRPDRPPEDEVRRITQRLTEHLEEEVRKAPQEWLWLHRRWKTQPGTYEPVRKAVILAPGEGPGPPGGPPAPADRPVEHLVDELIEAGLDHICFVVGPDADDALRERIARIARDSAAAIQCVARPEPGGSADALLAAEPFVRSDTFLLANGCRPGPPSALPELAARTGRSCWLAAVERGAGDPSLLHVAEDGELLAILDAPARPHRYLHDGRLWTDAGLYRLTADIFDACRRLTASGGGRGHELRAAIADMLDTGHTHFHTLLCPPASRR